MSNGLYFQVTFSVLNEFTASMSISDYSTSIEKKFSLCDSHSNWNNLIAVTKSVFILDCCFFFYLYTFICFLKGHAGWKFVAWFSLKKVLSDLPYKKRCTPLGTATFEGFVTIPVIIYVVCKLLYSAKAILYFLHQFGTRFCDVKCQKNLVHHIRMTVKRITSETMM